MCIYYIVEQILGKREISITVILLWLQTFLYDADADDAVADNAVSRAKRHISAFQEASRGYIQDSTGLVYPPNRKAVKWIQEFRKNETSGIHQSLDARPLEPRRNPCDGWHLDHNSAVMNQRRNVLIVPVGKSWSAEKWLDRPQNATFDVIALYYGDEADSFKCPLCAAVYPMKGPAWRLYYQLTSGPFWKSIALSYDYIMLPDDDLEFSTCSINTAFDIMRRFDLILAQPSVCLGNNSSTWRPGLQQRIQYEVRFTNFVEIMCPIFRMDFFDIVVRWTLSKVSASICRYQGWSDQIT